MPSHHKTYTVYPSPEVVAQLGEGSRMLSNSLTILASLSRQLHLEITAELADREVWKFLSELVRDRFGWINECLFDLIDSNFEDMLTEEVHAASKKKTTRGRHLFSSNQLEHLFTVISRVGNLGSWVIIHTAAQCWKYPDIKSADEWWTVEYQEARFKKYHP